MADETSMASAKLLRKAEAGPELDVLREGVPVLTQALMELEVTQHVGAERHERTPGRSGQRNGYQERAWDTRVGTAARRVPRVRNGGFFPGPPLAPAPTPIYLPPWSGQPDRDPKQSYSCPGRNNLLG